MLNLENVDYVIQEAGKTVKCANVLCALAIVICGAGGGGGGGGVGMH